MIRFEPRARASLALIVGARLAALATAFALAAIPLAAAGAPVGRSFWLMLQGAGGTLFALTETLTRATPLILTGLAAAVAFRARLFNIGAEGQLYAGAMAAVAVGSGAVSGGPLLLVPLVLLAAALAGAALMLVPTVLKVRLGVDEVVTTLLLNFVVLLVAQMMLEGPLKDPMGGGWPQSEPILDQAMLPPIVERMRLHGGFLLGLLACVVAHVLMTRSVLGLRIRAVGENATAAAYAGIPILPTMLAVGALSGGLAGLAGASEVAGLKGYLTADLSRGFGYAGIVVAMVAGLQPLAVVPAAILVAGVFVGADTMSRTVGVSNYIADLIVALALVCVLVSGLFVRFRVRIA
ncbi:ABC transporter permease [Salinarimonas soli]|uniref:ABC transporter permease n=1 Tax=Salinarimonas soli TaxID=1638099 RepID=A0A5B2VD87_9HYPH|nr:ABC transporter permease [Salinarimonas soli]